jgi:hypothetical protein
VRCNCEVRIGYPPHVPRRTERGDLLDLDRVEVGEDSAVAGPFGTGSRPSKLGDGLVEESFDAVHTLTCRVEPQIPQFGQLQNPLADLGAGAVIDTSSSGS